MLWALLLSVCYWLGFLGWEFRRRKQSTPLSLMPDVLRQDWLSGVDLGRIIFLPLLSIWLLGLAPMPAGGLSSIGTAAGLETTDFQLFLPTLGFVCGVMSCLLFTKRLWLLSGRYGRDGALLNRYFGSGNVHILLLGISRIFAVLFLVVQAKIIASFSAIFVDEEWFIHLLVVLSLLFPATCVAWLGTRGLKNIYRVQAGLFFALVLALSVLFFTYFDGFGDALQGFNAIKAEADAEISIGTAPLSQANELIYYLSFGLVFLAIPVMQLLFTDSISERHSEPAPVGLLMLAGAAIIGILLFVNPLLIIGSADSGLFSAAAEIIVGDGNLAGPLANTPSVAAALADKILLVADEYPALAFGLMAAILICLQAASMSYLTGSSKLFGKFWLKLGASRKAQEEARAKAQVFAIASIAFVVVLALAVYVFVELSILELWGLALGVVCQALPTLVALTYWRDLNSAGIVTGGIIGVATVILGEPFVMQLFGAEPLVVWPLGIHTVVWATLANFALAYAVSLLFQEFNKLKTRHEIHRFVALYAGLPDDKHLLKLWGTALTLLWLLLGAGYLLFVYDFPALINGLSFESLGIPALYLWYFLWFGLSVLLFFFLAYGLEFGKIWYNYYHERNAIRSSRRGG